MTAAAAHPAGCRPHLLEQRPQLPLCHGLWDACNIKPRHAITGGGRGGHTWGLIALGALRARLLGVIRDINGQVP
jgi:hypothetical protein